MLPIKNLLSSANIMLKKSPPTAPSTDLLGLILGISLCFPNLEPITIRGIESNGMLLAAKKGKDLSLIIIDSDCVESGTKVF